MGAAGSTPADDGAGLPPLAPGKQQQVMDDRITQAIERFEQRLIQLESKLDVLGSANYKLSSAIYCISNLDVLGCSCQHKHWCSLEPIVCQLRAAAFCHDKKEHNHSACTSKREQSASQPDHKISPQRSQLQLYCKNVS